MEESTSREKILKSIRYALLSKLENPFKNVDFSSQVFVNQDEVPEVQFAIKLNESGGTFVYCENEKDVIIKIAALAEQKSWDNIFCADNLISEELTDYKITTTSTAEEFKHVNVSIATCDFLVSRFGSIMVSSGLGLGRQIFVFPETLIIIAKASQVVPELKDALLGIKKKYVTNFPSQITVITGPSRTADIEKTLVMGAHGSKNLYVFMIDDI
jgi:L-lactate dehydrogenase complex protein LldG